MKMEGLDSIDMQLQPVVRLHKMSDNEIRKYNNRSKERQFKCTVCDKAFNRPSALRIHLRTHTGEKPYKCDVCEKAFSQASHLRVHEKRHVGVKPFKCTLCDKEFYDAGHLKKHLRIHSGEKV